MPRGLFSKAGGGATAPPRSDLDQRLDLVEGGGDELIHTPSVASDLATGMATKDAAKAQRLREQVRIIDSELAETKAAIIRQRLLRGPSGRRFECDADCVVGGCGESFAEEDGVLWCDLLTFLSSTQIFLTFPSLFFSIFPHFPPRFFSLFLPNFLLFLLTWLTF